MKSPNKVILATIGAQLLSTLILVFVADFDKQLQNQSILIGSGVSLLNFILLATLWRLIFSGDKKRVALAILLIVIKYSILIWVLMVLPKALALNGLGFAVGILINPAAVIVVGLIYGFLLKNEKISNQKK